jgi:hypothetical protein
MKLTLKIIKDMFRQEMDFCLTHPDVVTPDYQTGFMDGIRQAQLLIVEGEKEMQRSEKQPNL